ncbi:HD domain-containing protein [Petralouisia muris]|uniref:HD domain-containing protein n=1 Tax=Petralouisia muris TaxID=3032872 RepID=A0AC61S058_9FIRM|nr:HD domain-containing protein [Petralouisia muris]TGY97672.1 HD domain-containing protein [Petralouisia muris]
MKYVNRLLQETEYLQMIKELEQKEKERIFCGHGLSHALDVARIGWILALERGREGTKESGEAFKEKIYLTALLHDLGRLQEMKHGIPHHRAGAALAGELLEQIQYPRKERNDILEAVSGHRGEQQVIPASDSECRIEQKSNIDFINLIKEADNRSRNCFCCSVQEGCNWSEERRNQGIFW